MPIPHLSPSTVFSSKDSMQHSKVSESGSLDLALESLSLSSFAEEKFEASSDTNDLISSSKYDSSESEVYLHPIRMLTPFDVYYAKDDDTLPVPVSAKVPSLCFLFVDQ
ncbi:hypothetical protein KP509_16G046500 [Ceratopteris richardii]|uniref:Uncharacterized protein n=1 Tax=Ceratopteris richardii TaxID=49495 RepID=A0A8T2T470_CERRI|nr:hypothetical protein KP509_16G046500 [Ceratopteris richardii]